MLISFRRKKRTFTSRYS